MEDQDAMLVRRWQRGEDREQVFQEIYRLYYRRTLSFFVRKGFPEEEGHDLCQEVFVRVYKSLDTFRFEGSLAAWMFSIASFVYKHEIRQRRTQKRSGLTSDVPVDELSEELSPAVASFDPLDAIVEEERRQALERALSQLPPQMRQCATLRFQGGLKYREIAIILRISIDTVKAHLAQARQAISQALADPQNGRGEERV